MIENLKLAVKEQNRIVTNLITHPPKPIPRDDLFTPFDTEPWKRNIAEIEDAFEKGLFKKFDEWKARITEEKILGKVALASMDVPPPKGQDVAAVSRPNAAAYAGSKEAFNILFGNEDYQKKLLTTPRAARRSC